MCSRLLSFSTWTSERWIEPEGPLGEFYSGHGALRKSLDFRYAVVRRKRTGWCTQPYNYHQNEAALVAGKHLLVITPSLQTPSYRYRIAQYVPYLERAGFETETVEIAKITSTTMKELENSLVEGSAIFLQKKLLNHSEASLLRLWSGKIIFDFDDAIFLPAFDEASGLVGLYKRWRRHRKFICTLHASALILCANDYLAAKCSKLGFQARVIPTAVPLERYHAAPIRREDGTFTIGWIGLATNLRYLNLVRSVLKRSNEQFSLVLKVITSQPANISDCPVAFKAWRWEDEADDLASLDVGIMPLTDDPWTRGKAGFKALQYMAAGLPAVCSDVGMNREIIQHGENGFLVNTADDWVEVLGALARDRDLRRRVGEKARATVAQKYSLEVIAPAVVDAIGQFIRHSRKNDTSRTPIAE